MFLSFLYFTLATSVHCVYSLALGTFWVFHWRFWTCQTLPCFLYTAQASCLLKTHVLGFYFTMSCSFFLQLPSFPSFLSQLLFLSLLEFYFLLIGFLGCVNFLRCTLLLIFLYLIRCYWSPNAYYLFWMFWGRLGWAGFSAYPLSSAGPSN